MAQSNLPIDAAREEIVKTVKENQVTILVGETGSGKTTRLPVFLYEAGIVNGGKVAITQPRRLATFSVAKYVAEQLNTNIGELVGYKIRFDDNTNPETKIRFMTDGVLLRELQSDPDLSEYDVVVIDEAHERSQNIDFALGLLKNLLQRRSDLKLIVTSATIDEEKFSNYFWNAPILNVSGRTYGVTIEYSGMPFYRMENLLENIEKKIVDIHSKQDLGDILVFLPGIVEINTLIDKIENRKIFSLVCLPLYAGLSPEEQGKIFASYGEKRKVIVATNIAETSITVDGVVYVIDSGLVKQTNFHPESGIQSLDMVNHSRSGCDQRAGRAGRTQDGYCYRMYTEEDYMERPEHTKPEIQRTSVAGMVLAMEDIGIKNIKNFDFIDPPKKEAYEEAYQILTQLGAITGKGLTDLGRSMANLPLEPQISKMVLEAENHGCVNEIVAVAGFLSVRNVFVRPKGKEREADMAHYKFKNIKSDILTNLKVWEKYKESGFSNKWCFGNYLNAKSLEEVRKIYGQLLDILRQYGIKTASSGADDETIMKTVAKGLIHGLLVNDGRNSYRGFFNTACWDVYIHPGSSVFGYSTPRFIISGKILDTTKRYAHIVTNIDVGWLPELLPSICKVANPRLSSVDLEAEKATAIVEIILNGEKIGETDCQIDIETAEKIQENSIKKAKKKGLIPLTFKCYEDSYLGKKAFAEYQGITYTAWISCHDIKDGETYWCSTELFLGKEMARTEFQQFEFPSEPVESETAEQAAQNTLLALAAKFNRR